MKNLFINTLELIKAVFTPLVLLFVTVYFLLKTVNISDAETLNVVLGVALGVVLGFIANIFKDSIDEFRGALKLKKVALKLLEQDARKIHRTMWLYGRLLNNSSVLQKMKNQIPPPLELRYWSSLSQSNNFLLLGSEPPFDDIFNDLWEFEKINEQIFLAKSQKENQQAYMFAIAFYRQAIEGESYRKFLARFISEEKVKDLEKEWVQIAQENQG